MAPKDNDKSSELRDAIINKLEEKGQEGVPQKKREMGTPDPDAAEKMKKLLMTNISLFGPNIQDMATFCRQLALLIDVGIPLLRSLRILGERTSNQKLGNVIKKVADHVESGGTFSSALEKYPKVFTPLFVNVIQIGELGGILEGSLKRLADILEKKAEIKKKVLSAMMYPTVALIVAFTLIIIVLTVAIPTFAQVYADSKVPLPRPTRVILAISNALTTYYYFYVPLFIAAIVLFFMFLKTPVGKRLFDRFLLGFPIIGMINTKIAMARFSRTLGSLLTAGIPLLEGISVTAETSENVIIGEELIKSYENVEKGGKMDEPLREKEIFPPLVIDMLAIGDEAGALDTILLKIADSYDSDVDVILKGIMSIIEPLLIIFLGGMVMFIALALLLPYFNLVRVINE